MTWLLFWFALIYTAGIGTGILLVANLAFLDEKRWIGRRNL